MSTFPLTAGLRVYLYNRFTRRFLSSETTMLHNPLTNELNELPFYTPSMAQAMELRLERCQGQNDQFTSATDTLHSNDQLILKRDGKPGFLTWINKVSLPRHSYQVVLEYGLIKQPSSSLGFLDVLQENGIFRLEQQLTTSHPTEPLQAYASTSLINFGTNLPVINPFDPIKATFAVVPNESVDPLDDVFRWAFYPVEYFNAINCEKTPATESLVDENGYDSHHNPVFPSADVCNEYTRSHPELTVIGYEKKAQRPPWWSRTWFPGGSIPGELPPDFCVGTQRDRASGDLPGGASSGKETLYFKNIGLCLASTVTAPPSTSSQANPPVAPLKSTLTEGPVVPMILICVFFGLALIYSIYYFRSR